MTVHLIKLCVGVETPRELAEWQARRLKRLARAGKRPEHCHRTLQTPRRREEILDGGSLYWVIKGIIQVRQRIVGFGEGNKKDGSPCCLILLDEALIPVRPTARRAFQGWRYLDATDAPADLKRGERKLADLPEKMRRDLAELGLI